MAFVDSSVELFQFVAPMRACNFASSRSALTKHCLSTVKVMATNGKVCVCDESSEIVRARKEHARRPAIVELRDELDCALEAVVK